MRTSSFLALGSILSALLATHIARAQDLPPLCSPSVARWGPTVDTVRLRLETRHRWRGYTSNAVTVRPAVSFGLWGRPVTTTGASGAYLDFEGWLPLERRRVHRFLDQWSGAFTFERRSVGCDELTGIRTYGRKLVVGLGASYYPHSIAGDEATAELVLGLRELRIRRWPGERKPEIYIEVVHDFRRYEASFARAGLVLDYAIKSEKILGGGLTIAFDLSGSVSDFPRASGFDRDFGPHAAQLVSAALWDSPVTRIGVLVVEAGYTYVVADGGIGPKVGMFALGVSLLPRPAGTAADASRASQFERR